MGREVLCYQKNKNDAGVTVDKSILAESMQNAHVWEEEQQLSMTQLATVLTEANNMVFTACFTTKPSEKKVAEDLSALKGKPDAKKAKELAKECLLGNEQTLVCRLSKAEGKLGRSLVIDIPTQGYRQIDHRTIKWIILDNVKYIVKK